MSVLTTMLAVSALSGRPEAVVGQCDPPDGIGPVWTRQSRVETRQRVRHACRALGMSRLLCAYADAVVVRESSGRAGVWHTRGRNELGLGAMGLSIRAHHDKWPGNDEHPQFCRPEVSLLVAHAVWWRAVLRYRAMSVLEIQAVYEGSWFCVDDHPFEGQRSCYADPSSRTVRNVCARMRQRGFSCHDTVVPSDLGKRHRKADRRWLADRLEELWSSTVG